MKNRVATIRERPNLNHSAEKRDEMKKEINDAGPYSREGLKMPTRFQGHFSPDQFIFFAIKKDSPFNKSSALCSSSIRRNRETIGRVLA